MTLGEDLFSVLVAVGLISVFVVVFGNSFSTYRDYQDSCNDSKELLALSDYVRNGSHPSLRAESPIVEGVRLEARLSDFLRDVVGTNSSVRILIDGIMNEEFFRTEKKLDGSSRSVSLPIVYRGCDDELIPARLIIEMEV